MANKDYSKYGSNISFIDMLFALLIGVFSIFILSMLLLGDPKKQETKKIEDSSQLMVTMVWDDMSSDDIDLWTLAPNGDKISYNRRENGFISLDRDDLGVENDFIIVNGEKQLIRHNEEIVRVRMIQPGHYVFNSVLYSRKTDPLTGMKSSGPISVTVTLMTVNPEYRVVFKNTVELNDTGEQATAFSFDIDDGKTIENISTDLVPFVGNDSIGLPNQG